MLLFLLASLLLSPFQLSPSASFQQISAMVFFLLHHLLRMCILLFSLSETFLSLKLCFFFFFSVVLKTRKEERNEVEQDEEEGGKKKLGFWEFSSAFSCVSFD
eukprot:m.153527 g.153527  ORF g.153527 m.153527 type:complete len:103 (+) comp20762_c0_seq1:200-508(+)